MNRRNTPRISFIGFGEAGQAMASGLRESGIERIAAWDILFPQGEGERLRAAGETMGVRLADSAADAVRETDMIIAAVTAASKRGRGPFDPAASFRNPYYLDINSVSPGRKQETERLLGPKARYVDVAVIAAIHPARHRTPMLVAGPHAETIAPLLAELDMHASIVGPQTGAAAAIKMIRSVMIKGIEALTLECFLAAARAGVLDEVTASLKTIIPASIGKKCRNTISSVWRATANAAPRRWRGVGGNTAPTRHRANDGGRNRRAPARNGSNRQVSCGAHQPR